MFAFGDGGVTGGSVWSHSDGGVLGGGIWFVSDGSWAMEDYTGYYHGLKMHAW